MANEDDDLARHVELIPDAPPARGPTNPAPAAARAGASAHTAEAPRPYRSSFDPDGCGCALFKLMLAAGAAWAIWAGVSSWLDARDAEDEARAMDAATDVWTPQVESLRVRVDDLEDRVRVLEMERDDLRIRVEELEY